MTERGIDLGFIDSFARKLTKGLFKKEEAKARESDYGNENFPDRPEEEQTALMLKLQELVAERRDLKIGLRHGLVDAPVYKPAEKPGEGFTYKIRQLGNGRRIRVPILSDEIRDNETSVAAKQKAENRLVEVQKELGKLGSIPGLKEAYEDKIVLLYGIVRSVHRLEELKTQMLEIQAEIDTLRSEATRQSVGALSGLNLERVKILEKQKHDIESTIAESQKYKAIQDAERVLLLRGYSRSFERGRMIEIPSVQKIVQEGMEHMRAHQPFLLAGHLGSGKTEAAKHMARLFMIENGVGYDSKDTTDFDTVYDQLEPEIFSGGDEASVYDLVGKLKLAVKTLKPDEYSTQVAEFKQALEKAGIREVPEKEVLGLVMGKGNATETFFNYGPLGRAIKRGVPIIIDEINLIPPDVVGRINDILTKRVGQKIRLQENGEEEFEIQKGFAVLATCNLGTQYEGIKEVNAAFKSRWVAKEVFYPEIEETFDLMLSALLRKDRVRLAPEFPAAAYDKLIDLAVVVREIQEIFSGRTEGMRWMALATNTSAEPTQLKKSVVSTRDLMRKIIEPWKRTGFKESLDAIIARNILAAEVFSADDQKFMTEIFIRRGFFSAYKAHDFEQAGIRGISQRELDALQVNIGKDEYQSANTYFDSLRSAAHNRAAMLRDSLLIGTQK